MHSLNEQHGYEGVNALIRSAFEAVRATDTLVIGRWFSGDEMVIVVPAGSETRVASRLLACLAQNSLSGTVAVSAVASFHTAVEVASSAVQAAKAAGIRGVLV
jgi:hypothetical protein